MTSNAPPFDPLNCSDAEERQMMRGYMAAGLARGEAGCPEGASIAFAHGWHSRERTRPMAEWQPIETAPEDKTSVDLWIVDRLSGLQWREPDAWYEDDWWWVLSAGGEQEPVGQPGIQDPSHWMPVPKQPAGLPPMLVLPLPDGGEG